MADLEHIRFDFSGNNAPVTIEKLEDILCRGHWSNKPLNYDDHHTALLLRLLHIGGIHVYRRAYERQDTTPEIRQRANELNDVFNKRDVGQALFDIARIFGGYPHDGARRMYNSLFVPELKAYVRNGALPPEKLLDFFEQDGCEMVTLFTEIYDGEENAFFAFTLAMPRELYMEALGEMREQFATAMHEALLKTQGKSESIIPPASVWPETD